MIDYKKEDYTQGDRRYDLIVDMVGNHSLRRNLRVLEPNGRLVLVGGGKGDWIEPLKGPLKARLLDPFVEQSVVSMLARLRADDIGALAVLMENGAVSPVIDRRFALQEVPAALEYSETGRARGKIVINVE